ncbi:serine/threonine-protein kinase PknD [Mycobacterium persicum]|uniref:non-specific serine/threonine protein kinase n=1 Tax=Mycobacterium persicum TaxID=1487726 RepID=A0AB38UPQ2_9MYCO|nr:serine/threonine-protein kinase PknD [Mycobacterium persicum]VAZ82453.1 Serine/threonine-protein kinase PknD [Mycobacterium persicum]
MTDAQAGARFGPYELRRLLGRGGMGEVYEAEDTRKRRVVALKLISPEFSGDPVFRARMQREADAAGRLTEPHVVPIHDYGEIDGKLFLEMRLVNGTDLATLLKRSGPFSPARAVAIVRQIAAALDAAHTTGVTHRDVKPENILITDDDFAYLVDFGIARAATDPGLTRAGIAMGTYSYMAPERFTGDEVTYRADIYSLACVLNECLTGSPPYPTDSIERAVGAHLTQPAPQPSRLRPGQVPQAFDGVIAKGMAKDPGERYRSAGELAAAAHQALSGPEQDQATTILRRLDPDAPAPVGPGSVSGYPAPGSADIPLGPAQPSPRAETMAAPVPPRAGSWRDRPGPEPPAGPAGPPGFGQPPGAPAPDFAPGAPRPRSKRKLWILLGAAALLVVAAVGYVVTRPSHPSTPVSGQTVLPFKGIDFRLSPGGVAVDSAGNVYVTSEGMYGRVVKLANGSSTATVLPFNGLYQPQGLAVDGAGAIYVTDFNNRVVMLPAGSNSQTVLPFDGLDYPEGVAVDAQGSVYVADRGNSRVVKLAAGAKTQTVLPFDGLKNPDGVAVDGAGNIYVADTDNNRVVKLDAGSNNQTVLPFRELSVPWGIAVDSVGNVYVTEHNKNDVVKLAAGSNTATVLPFTGLNTPLAVAVDGSGNVYVADRGNDRAVKLTL